MLLACVAFVCVARLLLYDLRFPAEKFPRGKISFRKNNF
jgi:hypothetical protein